MNNIIAALTEPEKLYSYSEIVANHKLVPKKGGIYAWYYTDCPNYVTTDRTKLKGKLLMYVGISPRNEESHQNLFERIKTHCRYTEKSAFRRSLGKHLYGVNFLSDRNRDKKLNDSMTEDAFVCWVEHETPWDVEKYVIKKTSPLLNELHNTD